MRGWIAHALWHHAASTQNYDGPEVVSMQRPAARLTDMHTCPMVTPGVPPIPHVGGPINAPGSTNVFIQGLPAARVTDQCICVGPPDTIVKGSLGVFINKLAAARVGDQTVHGGVIVSGAAKVFIGDAGAAAKVSVSLEASHGRSQGILDSKAETETSIELAIARTKESTRYKNGGLSLGKVESSVGAKAKVDYGEGALTLQPLDARVSAVAAEYEREFASEDDLLSGSVKAEVGRLEASASAELTVSKQGAKAEASAGASATAAQVEGEGNVRLTLKSIHDNTIGRMTGVKLDQRYDKGISLGVRGNAGYGAAAEAKASLSANKEMVEAVLEAKAGFGPMVGMAVRMAVIW